LNFFKRPAHTLLYLTGDKIYRLDGNRKGQITSQLETADCFCETSSRLPQAIETAISQTGWTLGAKVWILYSRLASYELSIPAEQIAGLDNQFVKQAVQLEYETISGETLANSQLGYQFLNTRDEMSHFWLNFIATETLEHLVASLKKSRSTLAGLAHAGGLPRLLASDKVTAWLKIEYWPNCIYAFTKTPERGLQLQIYHPEQNSHWQEELNHWLIEAEGVEQSEVLTSKMEMELISGIDNSYCLTPESSLQAWLELWLQHFVVAHSAEIPVLQQAVNVNTELMYSIASGVAALLLCGIHSGWMLYQASHFQYEFEQLNKAKQELDTYHKTVTENQGRTDKLEKELASLTNNLKSLPKAMTALKQRPAKLLEVLSAHSTESLVISDIKQVDHHLVISGAVLKQEASNQFASMIEPSLAKLGWKVNAPTKQNLKVSGEDKELWLFELVIEDLGLKGFLNAPKS
jgi:hypothetical protein